MRLIWVSVLVLAAALSGCTSAITMRNPATGQVAKCGPYAMPNGIVAAASTFREQACVSDFQRQGYVRMSD